VQWCCQLGRWLGRYQSDTELKKSLKLWIETLREWADFKIAEPET